MTKSRFSDGVQRNDPKNYSCKMRICWFGFTLEILFILFCILWTLPEANLECAGIDTPFDILPEGDHIIEYGSVLELFCKLNKSHPGARGLDSSHLQFYWFLKREKVILPNVTVLNDTTIKVDLVGTPLGLTHYFCSLTDNTACLTGVQVGYKPQPVLNFQCVSNNWENLNCHWTPPENHIKTEYRLYITLNGRPARTPRSCPNQLDVKNNSCEYGHETDPRYPQIHNYIYFKLIGQNVLGTLTKNYTFHHYAHVIPNKPENVTVISKTLGSVVIGWKIPFPVHNFPPGLKLKIEYKNEWENWTDANVPQNLKIYGNNYTYNITGLKYSYTAYDVRLRLKSFVAQTGPDLWSQPASITFVTPSTIPSNSPLTTQGGFDVVSSGNDTDVYIYWARIPEKYQNGDGFGYHVICVRDDGLHCGPAIENSSSFAKFPISSFHSYVFSVYSVNEMGRSVNNSYVFVPKYGSVAQPESFTKVAYDQGVFELSWKPVEHPDLSNYTIFWCKEDKDLPVPCKGYLDWVTVPKESTIKIITTNETKFYKFAIAANLFDGTSSGMVWSSCVISHDKVLKKVDDFYTSNRGSREVNVVWKIGCAQSSAFRGFAFYYCPVDFCSQNSQCKGNMTEEVIRVNGSQERNVTLTNLKPYTMYKLQISIIFLDGSQQIQLGPKSVSKCFSTLEDAPSVPLNLSATAVTNNSIKLSWDLPEEMNGILQIYKLYLTSFQNKTEISFNAKNLSDSSVISRYDLHHLVSYTKYNITLKACTSVLNLTFKCSNHSQPTSVTTLIGIPGKMRKPEVSIVNTSTANVSWELPIPAAGPLNYFQLLITADGETEESEIFNLTGMRGEVAIKACQLKHYTPEFRIRAINIYDSNITYYGPWSEATRVHCSSVWAENSVLIDWISGTFTLLIVSACLIYILKKGWLQCRKMKDVEVKLPAGLQSQVILGDLEKDNQDYLHLERWPPRSPETVTGSEGTILAPDQESLLDKKSDESMDITSFNIPIKNEGDSSGYSAGRESVSSSITSDTHISSDSGAEPDQFMIKPTAFELWNSSGKRNENNGSLRNGSPKEILNFPGLGDWDVSEPTPGYTKVGFTNGYVSDKNLPGKGYVTIAAVTSLNPSSKINNISTSNSFVPSTEDTLLSQPTSKNISTNDQPPAAAPKYVSLAYFEGQKTGESFTPVNLHNGRTSGSRELPKLSRLDECSERNDEKTEDSTQKDFSGRETDTETINEVPVTRNSAAMPPYVSVIDNSNKSLHVEDDDEEVEDEDEIDDHQDDENNGKENGRLPAETKDSRNKMTVNGVVDKVNNGNESISNYIPHHLFGKESVHT